MADWSGPTLTDLYSAFLTLLKGRDVDAATMAEAPTTPPTNYIRWNRTLDIFQEWSGSAWVDMVLESAGGGTGSAVLVLGTMASQDSDAVAITDGTIVADVTVDAALKFASHNVQDVGENLKRARNVYIESGLAIPVGTDKWIS